MKKTILGLMLAVFLITAVPAHAQVTDPVERARIIALIEVLLKRIEELTAQQSKTDEAAKKAEQKAKKEERQAKEEARWRAEEMKEKEERHEALLAQIMRMEAYGMSCVVVSAKGDGIVNSPDGTRYQTPDKRTCEIAWADKLTNLKLEKMELEADLD